MTSFSRRLAVAALLAVPLLAVAPHATRTAQAQGHDISGVWRGNDGGLYYIRQLGPEIYWYGEQNPDQPAWSNVAHGRFEQDGLIHLRWADVPKGGVGGAGSLTLQLTEPGRIVRVAASGSGFGGTEWERER